jgi:PAS domain S-box-containing protein
LFNSVSDVVYTHDLSGRFLSVNRAMETFFGCGADEMIGKHAADFLSPQIRPLFENEYLARLKRTGRYEGTTSILKKDGTKVYIEYKSERVSSETGDEYITGIGRDVTGRILAEREKERLEAQLRQAYKIEAVGTLSGGIAHDFNNLLSIIIGNTELIINDPAPAEVNRKCLEEILTAGLRARDVIRRLLTFARKSQENRTPQDLAPIVREALQLLRASIPKNIDLQWEIPGELHAVSADSIQVHQIMINLCSNASDAMSETGGRLTVSLQNTRLTNPKDGVDAPLSPGEYVMLRVEDTGPGILPDNLHRIFDPYFTTKEVGKGTGMGLAIVHGIVKAYNGGICVRSEPGKGTVFEILFPAAEYRTEPDLPATPKPSPGTERILFVDDEKSIADLHRLRLAKLGYRVETRTDSTAALELFRKNPDHFDLVITDMAMPKLTGDKLAEEILKIRPDIPVILCTGYSEHMTEERAKATGIRGFIEKPVDLPVLSNLIREVLSG